MKAQTTFFQPKAVAKFTRGCIEAARIDKADRTVFEILRSAIRHIEYQAWLRGMALDVKPDVRGRTGTQFIDDHPLRVNCRVRFDQIVGGGRRRRRKMRLN